MRSVKIKEYMRRGRRYRRVKGACDPSRKPWIKGPKVNVKNRQAQGYTGVKIFPGLTES